MVIFPAWLYFYPRSPCGERPVYCFSPALAVKISIHALLAESDVTGLRISDVLSLFLSTLSLRRATHWQTGQSRTRQFLSTPSLRRATCLALGSYPLLYTISIHALLAESDAVVAVFCHDLALISIHALLAESDYRFRRDLFTAQALFLSTLYDVYSCRDSEKISIHALLAESDKPRISPGRTPVISIHALLAESDSLPRTL